MALRSLFGGAVERVGSALGLPEFGISERVGGQPAPRQSSPAPTFSATGGNTNVPRPGGSARVIGGQQPSARVVGGGDVLGASDTGGGGQPQQQVEQPQEAGPPEPSLDFSAINEALGRLDTFEQETRSLLGGAGEQAEQFRTAATERAETARQEGVGAVERQQEKTERRGEEAESEQRRGFSEIAQQLTGRFGRGGFGQGIIGSVGESTLQTIGKIRSGVQETMQDLFRQRQQIEQVFDTAVEEAAFQAEQIKNQAKANLQSALSEINSRRSALQSQKADLVNRALENYRQQIIDINARNTSFQQQVALAREQANQRIREAQAKASNVLGNLAEFSLSPGETRFVPLTELGGAESAQDIASQIPGGVEFSPQGQFGVFSAPGREEENQNPFRQNQ